MNVAPFSSKMGIERPPLAAAAAVRPAQQEMVSPAPGPFFFSAELSTLLGWLHFFVETLSII